MGKLSTTGFCIREAFPGSIRDFPVCILTGGDGLAGKQEMDDRLCNTEWRF